MMRRVFKKLHTCCSVDSRRTRRLAYHTTLYKKNTLLIRRRKERNNLLHYSYKKLFNFWKIIMWRSCSKCKFLDITNILCHQQQPKELMWVHNTKKYFHTTEPASDISSIDKLKEQHDATDYIAKTSKKLQPRLPLVKNFFVGLVDKELLSFPEVIQRDDMSDLSNAIKPIESYFKIGEEDGEYVISKTLAEDLKLLGLYGINAPLSYDGKGWNMSSSLMAMELESLASLDVSMGLLNHRTLIDVLIEKGTAIQQEKFLPELTKGSLVATSAFLEKDLIEHGIFNTEAVYDPSKRTWYVNGNKTFVIMPPKTTDARELFVVLAQSDRFNHEEKFLPTTTIFLIDSNLPGVKIGDKKIQTLGECDVEIREVHFENVVLKDDIGSDDYSGATCILGKVHEGDKVMECYLNYQRLRQAMIVACMSKNILNYLTCFCINTKHCDIPLMNLESVRAHLGKATVATYGMESMIYLTAGLLDEFQSPDITLEAAITKYYSLKELLKLIQSTLDIIGEKSLIIGQKTEAFVRNALQLYAQVETMDSLSAFIAITGLRHAGILLGDDIRRQRNPLYNPMQVLKKFLEKSNIDNPSTKMSLHEKLHPSLEPASMCLEHSVARLRMCVELLLTRYGTSILEHHNETARLTEMSSTIYTMFASLARASRSYCIGLPLSDYELLTATTICMGGRDKTKTLTQEVYIGQYNNNDANWERLSKQIIKSKGYFAVNPLTYNF